MRYRLAVFLLLAIMSLLAMLPRRSVLAAPAPEPYAILDIGPPAYGETEEEHLNHRMQTYPSVYGYHLCHLWRNTAAGNLKSVAALDEPRPWLSKNLEITPVSGTRCLRLRFRAGTRDEQVVILNCLLRTELDVIEGCQKKLEKDLQWREETLAQLTKVGYPTDKLEAAIAKNRAMIAAYKQRTVLRWAK